MLLHETTEPWEIRGDARDAHYGTFGGSVAPRFVIAGEDPEVATADEFFVVQAEKGVCRAQEFGVEHYLMKCWLISFFWLIFLKFSCFLILLSKFYVFFEFYYIFNMFFLKLYPFFP